MSAPVMRLEKGEKSDARKIARRIAARKVSVAVKGLCEKSIESPSEPVGFLSVFFARDSVV